MALIHGEWSDVEQIQYSPGNAEPAKVTGLTLMQLANGIRVSFDAVPGADRYLIQIKQPIEPDWTGTEIATTLTTFDVITGETTDYPLSDGLVYQFRVGAVNDTEL